MMAVLGIWLWNDLDSFGPATSCGSTVILGNAVQFRSNILRITSLVIYGFFLLPGLNVVLPMVFFLGLFLGYHEWSVAAPDDDESEPSILPTVFGMIILCAINVIFIFDIELTLLQNRILQTSSNESDWTFGQILVMLLLVLPLWALFTAALAHRTHAAENSHGSDAHRPQGNKRGGDPFGGSEEPAAKRTKGADNAFYDVYFWPVDTSNMSPMNFALLAMKRLGIDSAGAFVSVIHPARKPRDVISLRFRQNSVGQQFIDRLRANAPTTMKDLHAATPAVYEKRKERTSNGRDPW
jgi:hypothetical protein